MLGSDNVPPLGLKHEHLADSIYPQLYPLLVLVLAHRDLRYAFTRALGSCRSHVLRLQYHERTESRNRRYRRACNHYRILLLSELVLAHMMHPCSDEQRTPKRH